jgi:hypothetical protein
MNVKRIAIVAGDQAKTYSKRSGDWAAEEVRDMPSSCIRN